MVVMEETCSGESYGLSCNRIATHGEYCWQHDPERKGRLEKGDMTDIGPLVKARAERDEARAMLAEAMGYVPRHNDSCAAWPSISEEQQDKDCDGCAAAALRRRYEDGK